MIMYIKKSYEKVELFTQKAIIEKYSFPQVLNKLAKENLFDIKGYKNAVQKVFSYKSKIPIYFNQKLFLFQLLDIKSFNYYYINYFALIGISIGKKNCLFLFQNGTTKVLNVNRAVIKRQLEYVEQIRKYKEKK